MCSENIRQLKKRSQLRSKIGLYGEKRVVAFPNFPRRFRERVGQFSHGPKQQLHFSYQEGKNWQLLPTTYLVSCRGPEGCWNHSVGRKQGTVRPRDPRPQAARTLTMHVFEWGQKNLRCTNLCSENLKLHGFLMFLPLSY